MGCSTSSPGPDGFNFFFYKSAWHIIGPLVTKAVRSFFTKGYMPSGIKATALALIPKFKNAESLSDFRPITLCNTFYKIIAKVISNLLKPIMPTLVKDNQSGFIKSRVSTDNILLVNKVISYIRKKGGGKYFCVKLDIRKAFDTVSREFLIARLKQKGFPTCVVDWIKACISDVNFSILINGSLEGYFSTSAGLRQGCPLSPYLFCLVMDAFSNLLDAGSFKGITLDGFTLTHLLYADDVIIFGEATTENCISLKNILNTFANASGLQVNLEKSSILLPNNLSNPGSICQALSIPSISEKIVYLGIPLSFKRLKLTNFMPLMESITKKLSGWKANLLSFAGRLQFLRYTILNSIAYWICGSIIPKSIFKFFKKIYSKFLFFFGDHLVGRKLHMVFWDKCCIPKENGGLGLPSFLALQFATHCSLILRSYNASSPLSTWMFTRYSSPWRPPSSSSSSFWLSVCRTAIAAKAKFHFKITSIAPISMHWDHWFQDNKFDTCPDGVLLLNAFHTNSPLKVIISDMSWNLPDFLPSAVCDLVSAIPILDSSTPCLRWDNIGDVKFRCFILEFYSLYPKCSWNNIIWHSKFALRYSCYSWMAVVGGLKTADALNSRNISVPMNCSLYHEHIEKVTHLFFECSYSFVVISKLIPPVKRFLLRPTILQLGEWIDGEAIGNLHVKSLYHLLTCCAIYFIWRERNNRRFGNSVNCYTTTVLCIKKAVLEKVLKWRNNEAVLDFL
ncbi:Putative ribonuclease H protein [Dendrobium catenatum]|uniref:Ribonuclease H protein n=1 Tax=Dendrobium catenatum TaxID=906689 RepID=A0A2I0WT04_9ASPA|nr:Putative ribonuclease H protein [Dendrobium catenatum]